MQPSNNDNFNSVRISLSAEGLQTFNRELNELSDAVCRGCLSKQIQKMIADKEAGYHFDAFGRNPLHYAAIQGRESVIDLLINHDFDANKADIHNLYPLHLAIQSKNYEAAIKLSAVTKANLANNRNQNAIILVSKNKQSPKMIHLMSELVKNGNNINWTDNRRCNALFYAVDKPILIKHLLQNGIDVNHKDEFNRNALFNAVYAANIESMKLLICGGSEIEIFDDFEHTPLMLAACFGTAQIVQILIDSGSNVNAAIESNLWLMTPLTLAIRHDNYQIAHTLIENGAEIDVVIGENESIWDLIKNESIYDFGFNQNDKQTNEISEVSHIERQNLYSAMNSWRRVCSKYKEQKRMALKKYMERVQRERTMQSLIECELVKKLNVPLDVLNSIASPLTWY